MAQTTANMKALKQSDSPEVECDAVFNFLQHHHYPEGLDMMAALIS